MKTATCYQFSQPPEWGSNPVGFPIPIPSGGGEPLADELLVALARDRNVAAFDELYRRYERRLYHLAMRFVHNASDAEEILQDVFMSTWRKLPGYEGRAQIGSWLHRVTVNASLMFLRARRRRPDLAPEMEGVFEQAPLGGSPPQKPDEHAHAEELRQQIHIATERLPSGLRCVLLQRDVEGQSTATTARSLGLTHAAVKTRLHRARRAMRRNLVRYLAA